MKKILIIGSPGTGKSTLAVQLARKTSLPVIHLDKYWHDQSLWSKDLPQKKQQWRKYIHKLVKQEDWIMDGNYTSTLDIRIPDADFVIFLDYPRRIALLRTIKRRAKYRKVQRPGMPDGWQEKFNLGLLKKIWSFNESHKPRIEALLSTKHKDQYVHLKTPRETKIFLAK